jgi:hypothetical protein
MLKLCEANTWISCGGMAWEEYATLRNKSSGMFGMPASRPVAFAWHHIQGLEAMKTWKTLKTPP